MDKVYRIDPSGNWFIVTEIGGDRKSTVFMASRYEDAERQVELLMRIDGEGREKSYVCADLH